MADLPFVTCIWNDAWIFTDEFITMETAHLKHKPMPVETTGWLMIDDAEGVSIANERCLDPENAGAYRGRTFIPRAMVKSIKPFKHARKTRRKSCSAGGLSPDASPSDASHGA